MSDLETVLAAIPKMSASELAGRWETLGRGTAPRVPLRVLQCLYAQLLQEQVLGGLSAEALEELAAVAAKAGKSKAPTPPPPRQLMLTAGTRLVREWTKHLRGVLWRNLRSTTLPKSTVGHETRNERRAGSRNGTTSSGCLTLLTMSSVLGTKLSFRTGRMPNLRLKGAKLVSINGHRTVIHSSAQHHSAHIAT